MKNCLFLIPIVLIFISCKSKVVNSNNDEMIIVNKALFIAKPKYILMNLLITPDNSEIIRFKDGGFEDENHYIYKDTFHFKNDKIERWNKNIAIYNKEIKGNIYLIKDFGKIKKVSHSELEKSKTILSISNVMFSQDGKLAIINISTFSNLESGDIWRQMYVFKKEGDEWEYLFEFMTSIS